MPPPTPPEPIVEELLAAADVLRDAELRGRELPLLKLSWVRRQGRRMAPLMLGLIGIFVASVFVGIIATRPLMLRNPWYGCLIVLWAFISAGMVFGWAWPKMYHWFSLVCPYCGATLSERSVTTKLPVDIERIRRCRSCRAVIIDPEA